MELWAKKLFNLILEKDAKAKSAFRGRLLDCMLTGSMQEQVGVDDEPIGQGEDNLSEIKTKLFAYIHRDICQFIEQQESKIPEPVVITWMNLLLKNMDKEKPMIIPDEFISDSMLDVWMKMKLLKIEI